jgi:hypothetical protein
MTGSNKYYSLLHKVMDADDYELILLEEYPCASKKDLNINATEETSLF